MYFTFQEQRYQQSIKNIEIKYQIVVENIRRGNVAVEYTPTTKMVADALTKALPRENFQYLVKLMGMQ